MSADTPSYHKTRSSHSPVRPTSGQSSLSKEFSAFTNSRIQTCLKCPVNRCLSIPHPQCNPVHSTEVGSARCSFWSRPLIVVYISAPPPVSGPNHELSSNSRLPDATFTDPSTAMNCTSFGFPSGNTSNMGYDDPSPQVAVSYCSSVCLHTSFVDDSISKGSWGTVSRPPGCQSPLPST
jgi:hypothetical protein